MDERIKIDEKNLEKYLNDIDINKIALEKAVKISYQQAFEAQLKQQSDRNNRN